jgi:biopolymer transport protein ExbD
MAGLDPAIHGYKLPLPSVWRRKLRLIISILIFASLVLPSAGAFAEGLKELEVLANGKVQIDRGPPLTLADLNGELQRIAKQNPRPKLVLLPDRGAKMQDVAAVLNQVQAAGFQIGFTVGPKAK